MADVLNIALVTFMLIAALHVKNPAFVSSDTIGLSIEGKELVNGKDTLILSSLWNSRGGKFTFRVRCSRRSLFALLILMCGNVEPCPGPINQQNCSRNIPELNTLLQKRGLKILHQNVRGLFTNMAYISEIFESFRGINILGLSETHIDQKRDEMPPLLFDIPGYSFVSRPRPNGKGGGVAAYISESLKWDRREDLEMEEVEVIWVKLFKIYELN
eukprot:Seg2983.1 transcript_id=Seg2983.1/GoldUCD/mRNA.D3Y31 product="hypothetical protein" protein_id=Seg2983.1/GoldUCD/D3Y31